MEEQADPDFDGRSRKAVNLGLVVIRHFVWGLDKDILENVRKKSTAWPGPRRHRRGAGSAAEIPENELPAEWPRSPGGEGRVSRIKVSFVAADTRGRSRQDRSRSSGKGLGDRFGPADGALGSCQWFNHLLSGCCMGTLMPHRVPDEISNLSPWAGAISFTTRPPRSSA